MPSELLRTASRWLVAARSESKGGGGGGEKPYHEELLGRRILRNLTGLEHHDAVAVHDCVQAVGDGEDAALRKGSLDGLLDQQVGVGVDVGRGLVQNLWEIKQVGRTGQDRSAARKDIRSSIT